MLESLCSHSQPSHASLLAVEGLNITADVEVPSSLKEIKLLMTIFLPVAKCAWFTRLILK